MSTPTAPQVQPPIRTFALVSLVLSTVLAASIVVAALTDRPNSFDLSFLISGVIAVGLLRGSDKATAVGYRFSLPSRSRPLVGEIQSDRRPSHRCSEGDSPTVPVAYLIWRRCLCDRSVDHRLDRRASRMHRSGAARSHASSSASDAIHAVSGMSLTNLPTNLSPSHQCCWGASAGVRVLWARD